MSEIATTLKGLWERDISRDFGQGILTYERDVQAAISFHLRSRNRKNHRHPRFLLFNEPHKFLTKGVPDLVVCNGRTHHIDAVIEIKFSIASERKRYELYKKDVQKLKTWSSYVRHQTDGQAKVRLLLNPKTLDCSDDDSDRFTADDKTCWVFAVIGGAGPIQRFVQSRGCWRPAHGGRFLILYAPVADDKPRFCTEFRGQISE